MDLNRIKELRIEVEAERVDLTEIAEIQEEFDKLVATGVKLRDLPENAMAIDQLDELETHWKPTQEELGKFVDREVYYCQSSLIDMLMKNENMWNEGFDLENVSNLFDPEEDSSDDQEPQEIYEWWIVSDWLLKQLEKKGQPILKTDYGSWWGRTCTGQAILLDNVIETIYVEMMKA